MREPLNRATAERMGLEEYRADYDHHFWRTDRLGFWKLERQQSYQEPGYDAWEAFATGEWERSLALLETGRADLAAYFRRIDEHGFAVRRVRVVEEPLTAYLQWELHALRIRAECGAGIRVVGPAQVAPLEAGGPLGEIYTLGTAVMYEASYDERGILDGAWKHTDRALILSCQRLIADLYAQGEPVADYFARRVAGLPAPVGQLSG